MLASNTFHFQIISSLVPFAFLGELQTRNQQQMPKDFDEVNLVKIFTFKIFVGRIYAMSKIYTYIYVLMLQRTSYGVGFNNINESQKKVF